MSILNRRERERLVLDLYNQGKTIREIAKEVRMLFRDIGVILNKAVEEKTEAIKQQDDNANPNKQPTGTTATPITFRSSLQTLF